MNVPNRAGIIILIGLPGSGKTTLAQRLSKYFRTEVCDKELKYVIHIIAYDDLIPVSIQKGSDEMSWKVARKRVLQKVETLLLGLKENSFPLDTSKQNSSNTLIIIDDNMYYRSMRYEYFQLARSYECSFCQLYLSCATDEALKSNATRTDSVPVDIVRRMSARLQPPDTIHNNWERNSLIIPLKDVDFSAVCEFIKSSLDYPLSPSSIQENLLVSNPSKIHEVDLALRKLVGGLIKEWSGNKEQVCSQAALLNTLRHSVLDKLRAGDITLPEENIQEFLSEQMSLGYHC